MTVLSFTYRAFISYSHTDHDWGVWLHRALERYRVPKRLAGARGVTRLGKCFRDEEELGAAHELGPKIDAALKASDVLIVVCSPRSAKSTWVNQEIEAFKKNGREHRVFALIVGGEPQAANPEQDCFPPALKRTVEGGAAEPLAVDVRKFGREDTVLRLVAGMLDVGYDDLRQRDVRKRRAEMLQARGILAAGVLLIAGSTAGAWFSASNYVDTRELRSALFAREADSLALEGKHAKAMLMALYGDPAAQSGWLDTLLRRNGFEAALDALLRAQAGNRLLNTLTGHSQGITSIAISANGKLVLTASLDRTVRVWRVADGQAIATFAPHTDGITSLALSPDDRMVLTGSVDQTAKLWSIENGEVIETFPGTGEAISSVAFSADGRTIATAAFSGATLWSVATGEMLHTFPDEYVTSVAFSPDGKFVATGAANGARIWSFTGGSPRKEFNDHMDVVTAIAYSPDGSEILTGAGDRLMRKWDVADGKVWATFAGHRGSVNAVSFSSDRLWALSGDGEGLAKAWHAPTGNETVAVFAGHEGAISSVAFSRDTRFVVTGSRDGTAKVWKTDGMNMSPSSSETTDAAAAIAAAVDVRKQQTSAVEIVRAACIELQKIGPISFTDDDYRRFPILDRNAPHPCAKTWGAPPAPVSAN